jgi:hypothetical protein
MKLPALWIAAVFAAGIGIASRWQASPKIWCAVAAVAVAAGIVLIWRRHVAFAWSFSLIAWLALGGLAIGVERAAVPANHISRLIATNSIDTSVPLRWRGRLREDPLKLPWGLRYEIDLENVQSEGVELPTSGGLRVNFYVGPRATEPQQGLRAGDRVEALMKARPPRNYLDPGAFDVHGFLARQKIDVVGSLRSGELLQVIDRPPPTMQQRLARARGNLLGRVDSLFADRPERGAVLRAMLLGDRISENCGVSRAGRCRASCGGVGCFSLLARTPIAAALNCDGFHDAHRACCIRWDRAGPPADSSRCVDCSILFMRAPAFPTS